MKSQGQTAKTHKPHLCFHCLRVTYVDRLRRASMPREVAMRLVNHASELVHQIYQRERVEDVVQWLADFNPDEWRVPKDRAVVMPPIPAGLDQLSPALTALIEQFPVVDALAVAAGLSQAGRSDRIPIAAVLERLSESEMRALLARVADGGGSGVMIELNRLAYPRVEIPVAQTMSCTDFAAKIIQARELRRKKDAEAAAAKRQREAELRKQHFASVLRSADGIWSALAEAEDV